MTCARASTRTLAPLPFQSVKFGASGLKAGMAAMRPSGTKRKMPSNSRSLRRACVIVRHGPRLAAAFGAEAEDAGELGVLARDLRARPARLAAGLVARARDAGRHREALGASLDE